MTWDPRAERIAARGQAAVSTAEAEAIRAQTAREERAAEREERAAEEEREERREQRRAERREQRRAERAVARGRVLAVVRGRAAAVAAVGAPEVIAWSGQYGFGVHTMHLGVLAPLLPVALEGGTLYAASLALRAAGEGRPAGLYRVATWVQAGIAAGMNYWHGKAAGGAQVGVALALTSLLGIAMLELTVALTRHRAGGRTAGEIRRGLIRRVRYPLLSVRAAALGAAQGLDGEAAWRAAWADRYGVGPESTRRERRTARVVLARARKADRRAARAGALVIAEGRLVRPAAPPAGVTAPAAAGEARWPLPVRGPLLPVVPRPVVAPADHLLEEGPDPVEVLLQEVEDLVRDGAPGPAAGPGGGGSHRGSHRHGGGSHRGSHRFRPARWRVRPVRRRRPGGRLGR